PTPPNGKNCDRGNDEPATGKDKSDANGCKGGHSLRQIDARQAEPDNAGCHQQTYDSLQIEQPASPAIGLSSHAINPCHRKGSDGQECRSAKCEATHEKLRSTRCPISHLWHAP